MAEYQPVDANNALGITQLMSLNSVSIRQETTMTRNKYKVMAPGDQEIFHAREDSSTFHAMFGGNQRSFRMKIYDTQNKEVITLRRPFTFGADKMDVSVCGRLVSIVRQEITFFKPILYINDARNTSVLKIKGPIGYTGTCDFNIFTMDKTHIGVIRKKWGGLFREMLSYSDNYELHFPIVLDVRFKAALIGASFLIDFLYYER